jgi:hypothetical protein
MNHQLQLISAYGDETFASIGYLICGLTASDAESGLTNGISTVEGAPSVSTNLIYAAAQAKTNGGILVLRRPSQPFLGYATATTVTIDRAAHTVTGNPLGYAAGRDELAWYTQEDGQAAMAADPNPRPSLVVSPDYAAATITVTPGLSSVLTQLQVAASGLGAIDLAFVESAVIDALDFAPNFTQTSPEELAHRLVIATTEALVISHLRELRWQGLALLGYSFSENAQPITIVVPASLDEHRKELDRLEQQLKAQAILVGELAWLQQHVTSAIATMRSELANALPEASK